MRQLLVPSILLSSALCLGPMAYGQDTRPRYDSRYGVSDFRAAQTLFASVRSDLDRAENNLPEFAESHYMFERVRGELSELQRQWDENIYEPSQVNRVIATLQRALSSSDLLPRDRDRLSYDTSRLRDFREDHE